MSDTIQLFGYLREYSSLKPHEVPQATDAEIADAVYWTSHDWRDDPEWSCVAIGYIAVERIPMQEFTASAVAALRKKQQEIRATAEAASIEIDRQINSLLAITNEVEA